MKFEEALFYVLRLLLFIPFTLIFIPAFLIVSVFQTSWSKMLEDLFGL